MPGFLSGGNKKKAPDRSGASNLEAEFG